MKKPTFRVSDKNKPGVKGSSRKRLRQFIVMLSTDEHEFLSRYAYENGVKIGPYIRGRSIPRGWRLILEELQEKQKGITLEQIEPRMKSGNWRTHAHKNPTVLDPVPQDQAH